MTTWEIIGLFSCVEVYTIISKCIQYHIYSQQLIQFSGELERIYSL